jgi:hypothetical protein
MVQKADNQWEGVETAIDLFLEHRVEEDLEGVREIHELGVIRGEGECLGEMTSCEMIPQETGQEEVSAGLDLEH